MFEGVAFTSWQDLVIAVVGFSFGFMLFPQLRDVIHGQVLNVYSAGLTAFGLYVLAGTFFTLSLWVSVAAEVFVGSVWLALFVLSVRNKRRLLRK